jgi:hypothetical protein
MNNRGDDENTPLTTVLTTAYHSLVKKGVPVAIPAKKHATSARDDSCTPSAVGGFDNR